MSIVETPAPALSPVGARWIGYSLAAVGALASFGFLFASRGVESQILVLVSILALLMLLGVVLLSPQAFVVTMRRTKSRMINFGLIVPIVFLVVFSVADPLVRPEVIALAAVGAAGVGMVAGVWMPRGAPMPSPIFYLVFLGLFAAGLGWGAPALINRAFDASPGQVFQAAVQSKYQTFGRGSHYHVTLAPWGPVTAPATITVGFAAYDQAQPGSIMCPTLHPGALGLAWYHVGAC